MVEQRAAEIKARYSLEEGKNKLDQRQFDEARRLFSEANGYLHKPGLSLAVIGLTIAPGATTRLISVWNRFRQGASA